MLTRSKCFEVQEKMYHMIQLDKIQITSHACQPLLACSAICR